MRSLVDLLGWSDLTPQEQAVVLAGAARGAVIGFVCWLACWAMFGGRRGRRGGGTGRSR
jgi:hypothetical protein